MSVSVTQRRQGVQDDVRLSRVSSAADRRRFIELPYGLYARDSPWVPPLRRDEHRRLSARHNPFHQHAEVALWLAWRGGVPVGRIAAIDDRLHNDTHRERVTWFGFFEATDDATAHALFGAVEAHARERAHTVVRGPASPSMHDSVGLLVDAFDQPPYILMPYNPPEYVRFVESAGYRKAKDLIAWDIDMRAPLGPRFVRLLSRFASQRRVHIRPAELSRAGFDRDLDHLKTIYRAAWRDNWGFVPPTDAEIQQLADELKPVLDPELALFAEIDGEVAGCALALPDVNQVLRRMNGRLFPFGVIHFLRRRAIVNRARVLLLGVLPPFRRRGLYPLLIADLHRRGRARGYVRGELSWTLEDNDDVNAGILAAGGRRHKTYRIYEKPVG
ncbi:MAG: N-acetyltransferase [Vicinamibacterales bacterium]